MNSQIDRLDLRFKPVENLSPRRLTAEQIAFYNREGYVMPFDVFTDVEAVRNRAYFDYLLAEMRCYQDGFSTYAINGYHMICRGLYRLATDPRILDLVEDLIGPDIVCWGTHFFCKLPHDPKAVPWHQDASYWPFTPARTVTVWLAIDDVDVENSAMHFIPATHNRGPIKWKKAEGPAVLEQEIIDPLQYGQPVADVLNAGQISLHADMLVHGSEPNRSNRRRCGLTLRYCPPQVSSLQPAWQSQSILCRGTDSTGNWANVPEPLGENLQVAEGNKPKSIGGN